VATGVGGAATARPATPAGAAPEKLPDLEVARVRDDVVIRPAQESATPAASAATRPGVVTNSGTVAAPASAASASTSGADTPPAAKRGFFSRLNPFSRSTRTNGETDGGTPGAATEATKRELTRPDGLPELAPPSIVRYTYVSPKRPADGNRAAATEAFKRGIKAQRAGERAGAVSEYQAALRTDPGFFDAYYNLGLVALDTGDARLSLWAYEYALSIRPDSLDARYNLALALKSGGYALDAADQLEILLQENSRDARAHLSLANLAAQQLKQPRRAREHYLRVLELQPRHPEAATIRYWLAANP
jgi:tetratricopeptide (TPR) repeat protein